MARPSYFTEKRGQNNDPNFFNRVAIDDIRRNVKRIIKDIRYDLIQPQDYNYFRNPQVLQACIAEAQDNYVQATILSNSLNFYINEALNKNVKMFPSMDIIQERVFASQQQIVQNARSKNWGAILSMFTNVSMGCEPEITLMNIKMIDSREISAL